MDKYQPEFSENIRDEEFTWIKSRREKANIADTDNPDTIGISLSGGGIRSATFNLGVLQAFENEKQLKNVDYLSSVSGGGYIASALTWFKAKCPHSFPFGTSREDHNQFGGQVVSWIRAHSSFLTPGNGINLASLLSAIFTGTVINLLIVIPIFMLFLYLFSAHLPLPYIDNKELDTGFGILMILGVGLFVVAFATMILTALSTSIETSKRGRLTERLRRCVSYLFTASILCLIGGATPLIHQVFESATNWILHTSFSMSVIGLAISWVSASAKNGNKGILIPIIVTLGLIVACLGFVMGAFHLIDKWQEVPNYFFILLSLSLLLAVGCNINLVSMHGYYRNRLRDAFLPYQLPKDGSHQPKKIATWADSQMCYLHELPITDAPYHLVNCNIELTGSKQSKYRNRAGDCFVFSPLYSGASATGYAPTSTYLDGKADLASVCAISGAAVATNTVATRSKPINFLMAMLNLRLGCWLKSPKNKHVKHLNRPLWYSAVFNDMFGRKLDENEDYVHLSDGGHFENLGVYELIRRKTKLIFAFDAGADPDYKFHDLGKLIELIRVDFGAKLSIDIKPILPNERGVSKASWVKGVVKYADGTLATFIYIKSSMSNLRELSEDINSYRKQNPTFPHQSTANQFFNEAQFEAYRELGFQITHQMLKEEQSIKHLIHESITPNSNN